MKKIYFLALGLLAFNTNAQIGFVNPGFEGMYTPDGTFAALNTVEGWGALYATEETADPGQGLKSITVTNTDDPTIAGFFGFSGTIVPGAIQQVLDSINNQPISGMSAASVGNILVSFMYKYSTIVEIGEVSVIVYDTIGTDRALYTGFLPLTADVATWTNYTISLTATAEVGTPHTVIVTGTPNTYFTTGAEPTEAGTYLSVDAFSIGILGINENKLTSAIAFPNPASDVLTITSENAVNGITVLSMDGKVVARSTSSTVNVAGLTTGVYVYEATTETGQIARNTFMKK